MVSHWALYVAFYNRLCSSALMPARSSGRSWDHAWKKLLPHPRRLETSFIFSLYCFTSFLRVCFLHDSVEIASRAVIYSFSRQKDVEMLISFDKKFGSGRRSMHVIYLFPWLPSSWAMYIWTPWLGLAQRELIFIFRQLLLQDVLYKLTFWFLPRLRLMNFSF